LKPLSGFRKIETVKRRRSSKGSPLDVIKPEKLKSE
jgi:hypothetical protein